MKINYPEMIIRKSEGTTDSEAYLSRLCSETFLSLWCYPNIYHSQGNLKAGDTMKGDGKELCDLLAVFGNHVFIFSDKDCKFPDSGDITVDWSRWYKRTIEEASRQVYGAEKWVTQFSENLYLDKGCKDRFPLELPSNNDAIIHRIVVAHGASERCVEYFKGGLGSLMLNSNIVGKAHYNSNGYKAEPFTVGIVNPQKGFVHIFDDITLGCVMQCLDTIADFSKYLIRKEDLFRKSRVMIPGEEDLLGVYLSKVDRNGDHCFLTETEWAQAGDNCAFGCEEGTFIEITTSNAFLAREQANKISYFWDKLIERFLVNITEGTSEYMYPPVLGDQEKIFRFLTNEDRMHRRALSEAFLGLLRDYPKNTRATRMVISISTSDLAYVFLKFPYLEKSQTYEEYREIRKKVLPNYLAIYKNKHPHIQHFIGIAIDSDDDHASEDIAYLNGSVWDETDIQHANKLEKEMRETGLLSSMQMSVASGSEYPDRKGSSRRRSIKGTERNKPCPCGSGKKYKHCCWLKI